MNHIEPFDYVIGLGLIGSMVGMMDINEVLRLLILLSTLIGIIIKTWEQIKKSEHFLTDIKALWMKIRKK